MKVSVKLLEKFNNLLSLQKGVLTTNDLWTIISPTSQVDFYRQLKKLKNEGLISKVCREVYVGKNFDIPTLVTTIRPDSYLSLEYALAFYNMIGTYSDKRIRPIVPISTKSIESDAIRVVFKKIQKELFFGIDIINGFKIANKEKALLDTLYLYLKGTTFYFDIYSDIDISSVNMTLIKKYLTKYNNPKFKKFVKDYFND